MKRVRISTTVDAQRWARAGALQGGSASAVVDAALAALIEACEGERERSALAAAPYDEDPDLVWEPPPGIPLAYDGPVPTDVLDLAARRREARRP